MSEPRAPRDRAADLRAAFDRGFAEAPAAGAAPYVDLLRVRIGGEPYALVLAEIASFHADLRVVPLPSPAPELLGVAAVRTAVVPVYDLRAVLAATGGTGPGAAPRWLVVLRGAPPLALAFDGFDGHARSDAGALPPASDAPIRGVLALAPSAELHQVIHLASIRSILQRRWHNEGQGT
jgi:chemotaxis signal transduction protein